MHFPESRVESLRLKPKKLFALNEENRDALLEQFVDPESPEYYVPRQWPDSPFRYLQASLVDDEPEQLIRMSIIRFLRRNTIRKALALMTFFRVEAFDMPALNPRALLIMKTFPYGCFAAHTSTNRHLVNPWLNWAPVNLLVAIYEIDKEDDFDKVLTLLPIEKFSITDFCKALETPLYHIRQSRLVDHQDPNIKLVGGRIERMFNLFQSKLTFKLNPDYPCLETLSHLTIYPKEVFAVQAEPVSSFKYTIFDGRTLSYPKWRPDWHYQLSSVVKKQIFSVLCMQRWRRSQFPLAKVLLPMLFTMILHNHYDSLIPTIDELRTRNQYHSTNESLAIYAAVPSKTIDRGLIQIFQRDTTFPFNMALVDLGFPRVPEHIPAFETAIIKEMMVWKCVYALHIKLLDRYCSTNQEGSNLSHPDRRTAAKKMFEFCKSNRLYLSDLLGDQCKFDDDGYPIVEGMRRKPVEE